MRICILSDIHYKYHQLNSEDIENRDYIHRFLEQAVGKYDLMVLGGDIFDLWYDWRYSIVKQYFPLLVRLYNLKQNGCRLVMVSGNHDFWFNDFLPEYIGIELYEESFSIEDEGKKIHICHGDKYTVNDLRYHIFRQLIRLPLMKRLFGLFHPDIALSIGSKMSRSSRTRRDGRRMRIRKHEGLRAYAGKMIREHKKDFVIMGHSHNPLVEELFGGIYANSGDWIMHHSYIEIISGKLSLRYFDIKE